MGRMFSMSILAIASALTAAPARATTINLPKLVTVSLPGGLELYPGPGAGAINNNCLACHSRDMVLNQPAMSKTAWKAEVTKMQNTYKAPIVEADVPTIVDYLDRVKGTR